MKKTLLWSLISICTTVLWIFVADLAHATDLNSITKPTPLVPSSIRPIAPAIPSAVAPITTTPVAAEQPENFSPTQVTQIEKIVHDYLVSNPQVLVEASQTLQAQQEKQMQTTAITAIQENKKALFDDSQSPSLGNKDAPATLIEFFDYQCGHCRAMAPQIEKLISEDKNLHLIFKELPIFGGMSDYAAKAALAADTQSTLKYYKFHNLLFTANSPLTKESVMGFAKKAGLNIVILRKDMDSPAIDKQLKDNFVLAQALKVIGTPTFVISNKEQTKFAYIPGATTLQDLQTQIKSVQ